MDREEFDDVELEINYYYRNGYVAHYDQNGVLLQVVERELTPIEENIRRYIFEGEAGDCQEECCTYQPEPESDDDWWPFFDGED